MTLVTAGCHLQYVHRALQYYNPDNKAHKLQWFSNVQCTSEQRVIYSRVSMHFPYKFFS